ncbi:GcrA family cell cycle regulator [Microvirga zambiensis]|uniref:GcrA family cell cycle regulator n=1 Tax=Microvirga zambiensis TaxID=1402137 RepID=UPI00191FB29A
MPETQIPEPSPRDRTTLIKLRARQCRFVVSDDGPEALFCGGQTVEGSSWCPWHRRLVYAPRPVQGSKKQ